MKKLIKSRKLKKSRNRKLTRKVYKRRKTMKGGDNDMCVICHENFVDALESITIVLSCGHKFHTKCMESTCHHAVNTRTGCICPLCRKPVVQEDLIMLDDFTMLKFNKDLIKKLRYNRSGNENQYKVFVKFLNKYIGKRLPTWFHNRLMVFIGNIPNFQPIPQNHIHRFLYDGLRDIGDTHNEDYSTMPLFFKYEFNDNGIATRLVQTVDARGQEYPNDEEGDEEGDEIHSDEESPV